MDTIVTHLEAGQRAARAGDTDQAYRAFLQVLQADPDNQAALWGMSQMMCTTEATLAYLERLLEVDPHHARARSAWATLTLRLVVEEAALVPSMTPPPSTPRRRYVLGDALLEAGVLTLPQLSMALTQHVHLARGQPPQHLGTILLTYGFLQQEQLQAGVAAQIDARYSKEPSYGRIGDFFVRRSLVTPAQLRQGHAYQAELQCRGTPLRLGEVLVQLGYFSGAALHRALVEWYHANELCSA